MSPSDLFRQIRVGKIRGMGYWVASGGVGVSATGLLPPCYPMFFHCYGLLPVGCARAIWQVCPTADGGPWWWVPQSVWRSHKACGGREWGGEGRGSGAGSGAGGGRTRPPWRPTRKEPSCDRPDLVALEAESRAAACRVHLAQSIWLGSRGCDTPIVPINRSDRFRR
jgi:hypothetical protein